MEARASLTDKPARPLTHHSCLCQGMHPGELKPLSGSPSSTRLRTFGGSHPLRLSISGGTRPALVPFEETAVFQPALSTPEAAPLHGSDASPPLPCGQRLQTHKQQLNNNNNNETPQKPDNVFINDHHALAHSH